MTERNIKKSKKKHNNKSNKCINYNSCVQPARNNNKKEKTTNKTDTSPILCDQRANNEITEWMYHLYECAQPASNYKKKIIHRIDMSRRVCAQRATSDHTPLCSARSSVWQIPRDSDPEWRLIAVHWPPRPQHCLPIDCWGLHWPP